MLEFLRILWAVVGCRFGLGSKYKRNHKGGCASVIKVSKYDIEPEDDNIDDNIKETFYDLYNDIKEGRYRYTTNQSLQKELERFRDNMAVDFYNLQLEFGNQKHGLVNRGDVKRCKPQIKDSKIDISFGMSQTKILTLKQRV